jgi:hypothetical protein
MQHTPRRGNQLPGVTTVMSIERVFLEYGTEHACTNKSLHSLKAKTRVTFRSQERG